MRVMTRQERKEFLLAAKRKLPRKKPYSTLRRRGVTTSFDLIGIVAGITELPVELVKAVMLVYFDRVFEILNSGRPVWIRGIGAFTWKPMRRNKDRLKLRFHAVKALHTGRDIEEMEKYAVVLEEEKEKKASNQRGLGRCVTCNAPLDNGGACPVHGTEPSEKRPEKKPKTP